MSSHSGSRREDLFKMERWRGSSSGDFRCEIRCICTLNSNLELGRANQSSIFLSPCLLFCIVQSCSDLFFFRQRGHSSDDQARAAMPATCARHHGRRDGRGRVGRQGRPCGPRRGHAGCGASCGSILEAFLSRQWLLGWGQLGPSPGAFCLVVCRAGEVDDGMRPRGIAADWLNTKCTLDASSKATSQKKKKNL